MRPGEQSCYRKCWQINAIDGQSNDMCSSKPNAEGRTWLVLLLRGSPLRKLLIMGSL